MIEPRFTSSYNYQTKLVVPDVPWNIYGHPANFAHFVKTPLVPTEAGDREYKTVPVKAHSRRRYIGDPTPSSVSSHGQSLMYDPGRKTGNAVPGWSFILEDATEKRQFTTTADVIGLVAYLETAVKGTTRLYTQGARYTIEPAAEGG